MDDLDKWDFAMRKELSAKKFKPTGIPRFADQIEALQPDPWARHWLESGGAAIRVHDSGDYFDVGYLARWLAIARDYPDILFYSYTKQVQMFKDLVEGKAPQNFRWLYSMGGKQDSLVNKATDRHADVFTDDAAITEAGYMSQSASDLLSVLLPTTRVGQPANNIPAYKKKMSGRTFSAMEAELRRGVKEHPITHPKEQPRNDDRNTDRGAGAA